MLILQFCTISATLHNISVTLKLIYNVDFEFLNYFAKSSIFLEFMMILVHNYKIVQHRHYLSFSKI